MAGLAVAAKPKTGDLRSCPGTTSKFSRDPKGSADRDPRRDWPTRSQVALTIRSWFMIALPLNSAAFVGTSLEALATEPAHCSIHPMTVQLPRLGGGAGHDHQGRVAAACRRSYSRCPGTSRGWRKPLV